MTESLIPIHPQGIRRAVERLRSEPSRQAAARAKANELAVRWREQARGLTRILGSLAAARSR